MPRGIRFGLGVLLLGTLALAGSDAQETDPGKSTLPVRRVEVLPQSDGLKPGQSMGLGLRVTLGREFHVNSHEPSAEYLIPTAMEVVSSDGLRVGTWEYPAPVTKKFPYSEEPLKIYQGSFLIRGSLAAPADSTPTLKQVRLALKYQACTVQRCYPPKKEEVVVPVRVVTPQTPTRPLHPEIFSKEAPGQS
jgi:Disulphide bond corrector protein DsbC